MRNLPSSDILWYQIINVTVTLYLRDVKVKDFFFFFVQNPIKQFTFKG